MKLRILNAGHAAIAYPSALLGHRFVHDAMADPDITARLFTLRRHKEIPMLPPSPGTDFDAYLASCIIRFANPEMGDTILRHCLDGSHRQPKSVLPIVREALDAGHAIDLLALGVVFGTQWCAVGTPLEEGRAGMLRTAAQDDDPAAVLMLAEAFGHLGENAAFAAAFARHRAALRESAVRDGLRAATT